MTEMQTEKHITPLDMNTGEHDKFKHYVTKAALELAILEGIPCKALCGKMWLPQSDPSKYPICTMCKEKYDSLPFD